MHLASGLSLVTATALFASFSSASHGPSRLTKNSLGHGIAQVRHCLQANYKFSSSSATCIQACQDGYQYVHGNLTTKASCVKTASNGAAKASTTTKKTSTTTKPNSSTGKAGQATTTTKKTTTSVKTIHTTTTTTQKTTTTSISVIKTTTTSTVSTTTTIGSTSTTCPTAAPSACTDPSSGVKNCFNLQNSPTNCGTCGNDCAAVPGTKTTSCSSGKCVATACYTGYTLSSGVCSVSNPSITIYKSSDGSLVGYMAQTGNAFGFVTFVTDPSQAASFSYDGSTAVEMTTLCCQYLAAEEGFTTMDDPSKQGYAWMDFSASATPSTTGGSFQQHKTEFNYWKSPNGLGVYTIATWTTSSGTTVTAPYYIDPDSDNGVLIVVSEPDFQSNYGSANMYQVYFKMS